MDMCIVFSSIHSFRSLFCSVLLLLLLWECRENKFNFLTSKYTKLWHFVWRGNISAHAMRTVNTHLSSYLSFHKHFLLFSHIHNTLTHTHINAHKHAYILLTYSNISLHRYMHTPCCLFVVHKREFDRSEFTSGCYAWACCFSPN